MALAEAFAPTHRIPDFGLDAWPEPDGTGPPAARLDPGLDVQVVERKGDWSMVACSNGWRGWVDGRHLVESTRRPSGSPVTAGIEIRGLSIVSLLGAVAIAGGSFLDWWKLGPVSVSAWDIPIANLLTGSSSDGFKTGPVLIVLALVIASTLVIGHRLPPTVLLPVAALAMGLAGAALIRGLRADVAVYPDIGLLLTLAGGALVAIDGFGLTTRGGRS